MDQIYRMQPAELVLAPDEQLCRNGFCRNFHRNCPNAWSTASKKDGIDAFARHFGTEGAYTEPLVRDTIEFMLQYIHIN